MLAGNDLFVRILPAGNGLEQLNRFFARSDTILGYFGFCGGVNFVLAADFRFIKALFGERIRILKAGNAFEAISNCSVGLLRLRAVHSTYGVVISFDQAGVLIAVVDVSDIATHFFFKRLIAEAKNLVVIIFVIKRFGAIN